MILVELEARMSWPSGQSAIGTILIPVLNAMLRYAMLLKVPCDKHATGGGFNASRSACSSDAYFGAQSANTSAICAPTAVV